MEIVLYPALVQGEGAAESIAKGIAALDAMHLDVLIVGRGGGSIEDLWAFNEEIVALAIFQAKTPIISAVGHETDTTIADYVADLRVATPTEGAKKACFSLEAVWDDLSNMENAFHRKMEYKLNHYEMRLQHLSERYKDFSPERKLETIKLKLTSIRERMDSEMEQKLLVYRHRISVAATTLDERSPIKRLSGGYSYVTDASGKRLEKSADVKVGDGLLLYLKKGKLEAEVTKIME